MVMNKKIVVRDSGIAGKGLYVVEKIAKGEVVRPGVRAAALAHSNSALPAASRKRAGLPRSHLHPVVAVSQQRTTCARPQRRCGLPRRCTRHRPRHRTQCWEADADEKEKYWVSVEKIATWPEDVQKLFYNNAYQVEAGIYSGACARARE
jgi:hypothetical protein